jgi:4-amino-4-deoxy-L-arabinose transferase-like glycosyltransferase
LAAVALSWQKKSLAWLAELRPLRGLILCLLIALPWFVMIMSITNGAFLHDSLGADMFDKVASAQEAHGAPFGTYLLVFIITGWPLAPLLLISAPHLWQRRHEPRVLFLAAWVVPLWLIFEAVPTKLPHYILPLCPALAIAAVLGFEHGIKHFSRWQKAAGLLLLLVPIVLILIGAGGGLYIHLWPSFVYFLLVPPLLWAVLRLYRALGTADMPVLLARAVLAAVLAYPLAYSGIMSADVFSPYRLSPRLAQAADELAAQKPDCHYLMVSSGYSEPSLALLMASDFRFMDGAQAGRFMSTGECRLAIVTKNNRAAFLAAISEPAMLHEMMHVQGINLNGGRKVDAALFVR